MKAAGIGVLGLLAVACGRETPPSVPTVVRIAHESDVLSADPNEFAESTTHSVLSNVFEGLVTFDRNMVLTPALAVGWASLDERTWQIDLRPGVVFHDGAPLTAEEVKRALLRARDGARSAIRGQVGNVREIAVQSERRLRLTTAEPDPLLINRLTYVLLVREGPGGLVGTGPYHLVRWDQGKVLEAAVFSRYWGERPAFERALFVPVPEGPGATAAVEKGEVDVLRDLPESQVAPVRKLPGMRVVSRPGLTSYYLWLRTLGSEAGPLADRRVRQALSLALDRTEIVRRLGGAGTPANQLVEKGVFGYVATLPALPFDPARARRLLAEAGHPRGFGIALTHRSGETVTTVVEAVREMLGAVGITVRLESPPWPDVVKGWTEARLPFLYAGWRFESGDAHSFFVDCLMTRDPARGRGPYNLGFSSPRLDRLIEDHAGIFGEANRLRHYEELMQAALEEMPIVPVYTRDNIFAVSERIRWEPRVDGKLLAAEMQPIAPGAR